MKDVLALLSPTGGDVLSAGAHYALALARSQRALLSVLIAEVDGHPLAPRPEPDNMQAGVASLAPSTAERLARTAELISSAAKAGDVSCEIVTAGESVSLRESVVYLSQVRDALVVDVYGPLQTPRKDLIEGALFGSGRPLVLVPQTAREFATDRIVVAWDATRSAVRAVHDALPLLLQAREVGIVSVVDDKDFWNPGTTDALCRYLARWNIPAGFEAITRDRLDVGTALLAHAGRVNADLLVMGGFAHGFERELMLGSATRDVFRASVELPILLSH